MQNVCIPGLQPPGGQLPTLVVRIQTAPKVTPKRSKGQKYF